MDVKPDSASNPPTNAQPHASWEKRAFREGAVRGHLVMQRCTECSAVQHKPRGLCVDCLSDEGLVHFVASGEGTVHSFTVTEQNQAKGFVDVCPYIMAYIRLAEGPRILSAITECDPDSVAIGSSVRAAFVAQERTDEEAFAVPVFHLC